MITDGRSDLDGIRAVRDAVPTAGMVPLVIAPTALEAAGIPLDAADVVTADTGSGVLEPVTRLLPAHRAWDRFAPRC
ncbi:hypothetical protein [Streptomyces sp. NPDC007264]|uniref:hypothetical protein n=1 Tax=Streptomyces sp. NPDC007264 TaxID=3364777 RepID=UPI0036DCB734